MTKREIASYISKHCCIAAARIDIGQLCKDSGFRPYDVSYIKIDSETRHVCFYFKKYFKYESCLIPFWEFDKYVNTSPWFWAV